MVLDRADDSNVPLGLCECSRTRLLQSSDGLITSLPHRRQRRIDPGCITTMTSSITRWLYIGQCVVIATRLAISRRLRSYRCSPVQL